MDQPLSKTLLEVLTAEHHSSTETAASKDTDLIRRQGAKKSIMLNSWNVMTSEISSKKKDKDAVISDKDEIVSSDTYKTSEDLIRPLTATGTGNGEDDAVKTVADVIRRLTVNTAREEGDEYGGDGLFSVECPNHHEFCPDNNTCCHMYNTSWGCCAMKNVSLL